MKLFYVYNYYPSTHWFAISEYVFNNLDDETRTRWQPVLAESVEQAENFAHLCYPLGTRPTYSFSANTTKHPNVFYRTHEEWTVCENPVAKDYLGVDGEESLKLTSFSQPISAKKTESDPKIGILLEVSFAWDNGSVIYTATDTSNGSSIKTGNAGLISKFLKGRSNYELEVKTVATNPPPGLLPSRFYRDTEGNPVTDSEIQLTKREDNSGYPNNLIGLINL